MQRPIFDPTAGERARQIRLNPGVSQPIPDPTDPHYDDSPGTSPGQYADGDRIVDPTDPACGGRRF
jgi:hypothetical protein